MDLNSVLCKYNLVAFNASGHTDSIYLFYLAEDTYCSGWYYGNLGRELGRLTRNELGSMSAEELEEFAVRCSLQSMVSGC